MRSTLVVVLGLATFGTFAPAKIASALEANPPPTRSAPPIQQQPKDDLQRLGQRLDALTPDQSEALRAVLWQDIKNMTVQQVYDQMHAWHEHPADYVKYMSGAIDRAVALPPDQAKALAAKVPEDFGKSRSEGGD